MTPQHQIEEQCERRDLTARYSLRAMGARQEFTRWREAHMDFSTQELLDNWQRIRVAWHLSLPARGNRHER